MNMVELDEVLKYENSDVVSRFIEQYPVDRGDAEYIFKNMLKWLWYCRFPGSEGFRTVDKSIFAIDEMWHAFILYTPDYMKFCHKYFGGYIHHQPTTEAEKKEVRTKEDVLNSKRKQYEKVYDVLGKDTFVEWYFTFPEKYSFARMVSIKK
jgi:hypothetical protein